MVEQWCASRALGQGYQEGFEAGVKAERGRIKPQPPDLLQLADEAIDACEDAKVRLTFSAWDVAGQKVRAYREARGRS